MSFHGFIAPFLLVGNTIPLSGRQEEREERERLRKQERDELKKLKAFG